jgi:hypothetical protein
MKKIYLLFLVLSFSIYSSACDNSLFTLTNQTTNPDGSITYTFDITIDLGALDATFYGFLLSFNSQYNTPQVVIGGTYPTTSSITENDLTCGSLNGESFTALSGANINSINNDSDWNPYMNMENVISFEDGSTFGSASSDFCMTIDVTVMGCVEDIELNAHVNNGGLCLYTQTTGQDCTLGVEELFNSDRELVQVIDFMGRETQFKPNTPLIFIYSDGTRERVIKLED